MKKFKINLERIINCHGVDNDLGMPDFILAQMVVDYLESVMWGNHQAKKLCDS